MISPRGDGIGLEVSANAVRGVRLSADFPGRVMRCVEHVIRRPGEWDSILDALVRASGELEPGILPTRLALFPADSALCRSDITGFSTSDQKDARLALDDADDFVATMTIEADAHQWLLGIRWNLEFVSRIEALTAEAGFANITVEPSPLALHRVLPGGHGLVHRGLDSEDSWAAVFDRTVPLAAASIFEGSASDLSIDWYEGSPDGEPFAEALSGDQLLGEMARLRQDAADDAISSGRDVAPKLRLLTDAYPVFPLSDVRSSFRIGPALGAALGAAGLAGRVRPITALASLRPQRLQGPQPWAIEKVETEAVSIVAQPSLWTRFTTRLRELRGAKIS